MSGPLVSSSRREFLVISVVAGTTSSVLGSAGAATEAGADLTKVATVDPFSSLGPVCAARAAGAARRVRATNLKHGEVL